MTLTPLTPQQEAEDIRMMMLALREARLAMEADEVPIGAIVVLDGKIIGRGHNLTESLRDVTAHAEMQAITAAAQTLGGKYLQRCTLYVTVEPCLMCAGAIGWSQLARVVYGAADPRRGYTTLTRTDRPILHPSTAVRSGVLADECTALMRTFFASKRT
jgi:tRNA(adenine34) deaminase